MAEHRFMAALNAATFPFISSFQPRSVVIGGLDNRFRDPSVNLQDSRENNPQNLPQALYYENVMPINDGITSVGYEDAQDAFPAANDANVIYTLRDANENRWLFDPAHGFNYVTQVIGDPWVSKSPRPASPITNVFSIAYVNGVTYICYANNYVGHWDSGLNDFVDDSAALTGINPANTRAIVGAGNYMIAITTDNSVCWSSLTNPLDFVPSVITGAGRQIPADIRGQPIFLTQMSGGFLVHCRENTVAALYTNNAASPWIFREVVNSGGVSFPDQQLSKDVSSGKLYLLGTAGLQSMNLRDAEFMHPQLTDFLGERLYETFDTVTNLLTQTRVNGLSYRLAILAGRYMCVSYGLDSEDVFSYALIYDMQLKRWGKLALDHISLVAWPETISTLTNPVKGLYAHLLDGSMKQIVLDARLMTDAGVLIMGRYQLSRSYRTCSQDIELEVTDSADATTVHVAASYNGNTVGEIAQMVQHASTGNYRLYQKQLEGENLTYIIKGTFMLNSAQLTLTKGAKM